MKPTIKKRPRFQLSAGPFAAILMFGLPLVVTNGFYNITQTKSVFFYIISLVTIVVFRIYDACSCKKKNLSDTKSKRIFMPTDIAFCVFAFFIVLSAGLSDYPNDVWYGANARYQGALTYLLYLGFYFVVTRSLQGTRIFVIGSVLAFCIVCSLGVLNCFDIDFLGFYSRLSQANKTAYISTIGNINFYSSYLCLLFPLVLCGFCMTRHRLSQAVYTAALIVGAFGMMVTASESFVIGYFASAAIIPLFLFKDLRQIKKYLLAFVIILSSLQVFMWIYNAVPKANVPVSQLLSVLVRPALTVLLIAVCVTVYLLLQFAPKSVKPLKIFHLVFLCTSFGGILILFVLANTTDIGTLDAFLEINREWGSYRGEIWHQCVSLFKDYSVKEKLIGIGPEALQRISDGGAVFQGKKLDQAHNEYLHYLMTSGICGALSYLGLIGSTVWVFAKKIKSSTLAVGLFAGLVSFWIQAVVNLAQPFSTPIMFTYIAVLCGIAYREMKAGQSTPEEEQNAAESSFPVSVPLASDSEITV